MDAANVKITGPCPINLDAIGFDRASKRAHCTHCEKSVHNLSNMTEDEARAFLRAQVGEKICVSYGRRADGAIAFRRSPSPAPTVVPIARLRRRSAAAAPAAAGLGLAAALAACTPVDNPQVHTDQVETRTPPEPEPHEMLAGAMMPEPEVGEIEAVEVIDGGIEVQQLEPVEPDYPVDMVEGEMEIEPEVIDAPCPGKAAKKAAPAQEHPTKKHPTKKHPTPPGTMDTLLPG